MTLKVSSLAKDFRGKTIKDICSSGGGIAIVTEEDLVFIMFSNMSVTAECMTAAPEALLKNIEDAVEQRLSMKDNLVPENVIDIKNGELDNGQR